MQHLTYDPLEPLLVRFPVDRTAYLLEACKTRSVLDLGCYDETATSKLGTEHWLHGAIARVATCVLGVDSSEAIPHEGLQTGPTSRIVRGDVTALDLKSLCGFAPDVIVAGELLEHLPNALSFLEQLRRLFSGRRLLLTTPNATSVTNGLLAAFHRESNHPDHLQIYSFKTLSTLCRRAGFLSWEMVPYHVRFTEMALRSSGLRWLAVRGAERAVQALESAVPLWSGGMLLDAVL